MPPLELVFAGTPEFAARHLESLIASPHHVAAVYTQPDRRSGRGKKLVSSPVKALAEQHGIPVKQPQSLKSPEAREELRELRPDLLVVVAYGLILPRAILEIPRLGCINVHASLLPRWRGAAPIERALLAGDGETGITIMQMDAGLDTGDMLMRQTVAIEPGDTRITLEDKLARAGVDALPRVLNDIRTLQQNAQPQQDKLSTYADKLEKADALIHWEQPAALIDRQVRACLGRQPAFSHIDNSRIRILQARPVAQHGEARAGVIVEVDKQGVLVGCGQDSLLITRVQLPGKNPVSIRDLLNARPHLLQPGKQFTSVDPVK